MEFVLDCWLATVLQTIYIVLYFYKFCSYPGHILKYERILYLLYIVCRLHNFVPHWLRTLLGGCIYRGSDSKKMNWLRYFGGKLVG